MIGLLKSIALESVSDLGESFPFGLTAHSEVHSHLCAFTVEMIPEPLENLLIFDFTVANVVLASPLGFAGLVLYLDKFARGSLTLRATLRRVLALIDVPAN
jgi:hypothetical protein